MRTLGLIVLMGSTLLVAILLGIASDLFGPLGKTLLIVIVVLMFTVVAFRVNGGGDGEVSVLSRREGESRGATLRDKLGTGWLDAIQSDQQMAHHILREVNRSRRFGKVFTLLVVRPTRRSLIESAVDRTSSNTLTGIRLFIQEMAVNHLRTIDIIGNSSDPLTTLVLLPETDAAGAGVAMARFKRAITNADLTLGLGRKHELVISVRAINYPTDASDVTGFFEVLSEFENSSGDEA